MKYFYMRWEQLSVTDILAYTLNFLSLESAYADNKRIKYKKNQIQFSLFCLKASPNTVHKVISSNNTENPEYKAEIESFLCTNHYENGLKGADRL